MKPSMPISVMGLAWYEPDDFAQIRAVMVDGHKLHDTYADWLLAAEQAERQMRRQGHYVVRVPINSGEFVNWCQARGLHVDAHARQQFASRFAAEKYRAIQKGPGAAQ